MAYFFSQSFPNTEAKFKDLKRELLTTQAEFLAGDFKVVSWERWKDLKTKYLLLAKAFQLIIDVAQVLSPSEAWEPVEPCFKCSQEGH